VHIAERPIPFERFLDLAQGRYVELVDGVVVEMPAVQRDHELCSGWLYQIIGPYVEERSLGRMVGSRIMVKTDDFGGRMPDLLFIRQERMTITQQKAVYGAPDLIIEIVSPNDRPSDLRALEADYARLGVEELVFIPLRRQEIRLLCLRDGVYEETIITSGPVTFAAIEGLILQAEWILQEPRPSVRATLNALLPSV
jgi:Uma2 family endonuclease